MRSMMSKGRDCLEMKCSTVLHRGGYRQRVNKMDEEEEI